MTEFPWEIDIAGRATWRCQSCGFPSPEWSGCKSFPLCVPCDAARRYENRASMRAAIEADRNIDARRDAACVGRVTRIRETEKAAPYELPDGAVRWIPKSLIVDRGKDGTLFVKSWFARKELAGLVEVTSDAAA
jgi:hypothetical protein